MFALVSIETCFFETFKNTSIRALASLNGLLVDSKKAIQGRGRSSGYKDEQPWFSSRKVRLKMKSEAKINVLQCSSIMKHSYPCNKFLE